MIEWKHLTSDEIAGLDRRLPVLLPIGLIEAHGPHLAVSVDCDTAEYFAKAIALRTGAIVLPTLMYGYSDEMDEYPGSLGLTVETTARVMTDLSLHLARKGFKRQIWLSGHGANQVPFAFALAKMWEGSPDLKTAYWNYWTEAGLAGVSHADRAETEIALAAGTSSRMEVVRDFSVSKPWYRIRSRHAIAPESGGINGRPSEARIERGRETNTAIIEALSRKLAQIIESERLCT